VGGLQPAQFLQLRRGQQPVPAENLDQVGGGCDGHEI
jgi:hypothetical protein